MRSRWLAAVVCGAILTAGDAYAAAAFGRYKVRRTFAPDKGVRNPFRRPDVLAADFLTTGFAKPDGSDIKVFAGNQGRAAEFKMMMTGPGDRARIAIRMIRGIDEYHVCYGGPPNTARTKWEPQVGLVLETRKFNGGGIRTPAQMRKLVDASGPSYGRWLVPNIFHGFNPFGPSDNYVSIYRGWLHAPKDGEYQFATTSDDASYFLVGGQVVSSKPRWGRGPANARFAGKPVRLKAGPHKIEYYHVEGGGSQFCVGAWKAPGDRFRLIPPSAFPGVFTAKQTGLRISGSAVPIDLSFRAAGGVIYENHRLYKVVFKDATPGGRSKGWGPKWSFGDGTSSEERGPEHVYFLPGEYTVTFALKRGATTVQVRQRIVVGADWEPPRQSRADTSRRYYRIVRAYDFKAMESVHLEAALAFFVTMGADAEIMKAAGALFERDDAVAKKNLYRSAVLLGERLRDLKKQPDAAMRVFRAAEKRAKEPAQKARLIRRAGDTFLYAFAKPDEALAEYVRILDTYGKLEDNIVRLAQIRIGDAYKAKGDHDRSLAAYRKAEGMLAYQRSHAVKSVRRGAFAQSIEDYVSRKQFDQAETLLDVWGWEHPSDRLAGHWSLVAAKLALAKGDKDSALREALQCGNANKAGPQADKLLLFAGGILLGERKGAEAAEIGRRVQKEFPESGEQQAAAMLECEGLLVAKQFHDAAKKAAEGYAKFGVRLRAEGAEKFLMIAANASLGAKDKDKAIQLLQLVVKDHPRTGAAAAARAKLKALGLRAP